MRVLHVIGLGTLPEDPETQPIQGVARVALEIARAQVRQGHRVWVVAPSERAWQRTWQGVSVMGLRLASWAHFRWGRRHYDLRAWVPLAFFTWRRRFDIVHAHGLRRFRPLRGRVRLGHFHYDPIWDDREGTLQAQAAEFRRVARDTDAQIAVSHFVGQRLRHGIEAATADGAFGANIHVVPNAVDQTAFEPKGLGEARRRLREQWGFEDRHVVFLFSGAIVPEKGVMTLAQAFLEVVDRRPEARLVLAGGARLWGSVSQDGPDQEDSYEARVRELLTAGVNDGVVRLLDVMPATAMPGTYAASDVVVAPSEWQEAFCLSILEGMAAGKPAIASNVGGIPEFVDERNGLLVEPGDVSALVASMDHMIREPAFRSRLSQGALDTAARYTWPRAAQAVEALYKELLEGAGHDGAAKASQAPDAPVPGA